MNHVLSERNHARGYDRIHSSARCFGDEIMCPLADMVSANISRITQSKLSKTKSI
jgi:hypothetical protein